MSSFSVETDGRFAVVTFDDGGMNLLSAEALSELSEVIGRLAAGVDVVVLLSGRSNVFAAGADMKTMSSFDATSAQRFAAAGQSVFSAFERLDAVTAVLIDGDCYGGALDLALAFDMRLATPRSRFAHPGGRIGIVTGFGGTVRLPRLRSRAAIAQLMLDNSVLSAEDAARLGVIDQIVPDTGIACGRLQERASSIPVEARIAGVLRRVDSGGAAQRLLLARRTEELWRGMTVDGRS